MKEFIDFYYRPTYNAIVKLTRLADKQALESLTFEVLKDVWRQKDEFKAAPAQGVFLYKTMLKHIFPYLWRNGETAKIQFLQKTLLIHPEHYMAGLMK